MTGDLILIDTSVWLEVLPRRKGDSPLRQRVYTLLGSDLVATTGMVRLELLGGTGTQAEYERMGDLLAALHVLPVGDETWDIAANAGFELRRRGAAVPFTDLLIAAVAMEAGVALLHRDRHFDIIAAHLPLKVEGHVAGRP